MQGGVCWQGCHCPRAATSFPSAICRSCFYLLFINCLKFIFIVPSLTCALSFSYANGCFLVMQCDRAPFLHFCREMERWVVGQEKALGIALFCDQSSPVWEPFPTPKAGICLPAGQSWLGGIRSLCGCAAPSAASGAQPDTGASVKDSFVPQWCFQLRRASRMGCEKRQRWSVQRAPCPLQAPALFCLCKF